MSISSSSPTPPLVAESGSAASELLPGLDRNIALELCRVTEAAALAAGRLMGMGDKTSRRRRRHWEHRMVSGDESMLESIMAQMGEEEWELVSVVDRKQNEPTLRPEGFYLFFKRPVCT